jgi:hypothetical protein
VPRRSNWKAHLVCAGALTGQPLAHPVPLDLMRVTKRELLPLTEVIDLFGQIQTPQCHSEQEPQPGHDAIAVAGARAGIDRRTSGRSKI